jgi:SAM-dependent methyltransferase
MVYYKRVGTKLLLGEKMNATSYDAMATFVNEYMRGTNLLVCDVGSYDVNGTYKPLFENHQYVGLDIREGPNVDVVSKELYHYPFPLEHFDVVISGQTIEHVPDIYKWIRELERILKVGGLMCVIGPAYFRRHRRGYPVDCWRVYPDGLRFLFEEIAKMKALKFVITEKYQDCMGIAQK